eukprot:TRINITY_DN35811_c0_g1_i2.p1 TRINITY_DN35811_c0_g1~~TRINITY_DN35811_c0_g1_i2.p1  ORF type:complete len:584 (-),score=113.49 TRINITY_DN35811_c0_g1_i2:126-1877(-)
MNYREINKDPSKQTAQTSNKLINKLHADGYINNNTQRWALTEPKDIRTHIFYHLPKIHKTLDKPPGRPIVSGVGGPTETLSKLVDHWLRDIVIELPSYIKDSTHMLRLIQDWNTTNGPFPSQTLLVSIDVVGLYTNIPHEDMMNAVKYFLITKLPPNVPPTERVLEIIHHVLTNNVFTFEGKLYEQIHGTAMGTPMAPSVANIFMGWLESNILENSPVRVNTEYWKRFIDDIFLLWLGTQEELDEFFSFLNSVHPTIKFTFQTSRTQLPFLDLSLQLENGHIETDLYTKPTDAHAYLHYSSCHPPHCKNNIPFSQFLRARRLCSRPSDFEKRSKELEDFFTKRGYPRAVVAKAKRRASETPRLQTLDYKTKALNDRTPFVITFNPCNPPLRQWLRESQPLLHSSARMKHAMPDVPVVGERNPKTFRNILMPSALPSPQLQSDVTGSHKCKNQCVICREHLVECQTFQSNQTGEVFSLRKSMSCNTTNIVYMLFCAKCHTGAQYVGETKNSLKTRFYLHRTHIKQNTGTHVTKHFNNTGHTLQDMRCIPIEIVHTNNLTLRLKRELFWIHKLKTTFPFGLNAAI